MLFKANITAELIESKEKLAEQLYIFLNDFVPMRLRYESADEIEDCIQETMMYLFLKINNIPNNILNSINIEKFVFNRSNTFVSFYFRNLKKYRKYKKIIVKNEIDRLLTNSVTLENIELINLNLLHKIISKFNLNVESSYILEQLTFDKFYKLGYAMLETDKSIFEKENLQVLDALSFAVVDEYMEKSIKEKIQNEAD
jgi:hypothetical protein